MIYIPAGNFKKGESKELTSLQDIYLDGYWLAQTEVSTAQYMTFARESGANYSPGIESKGNDYPVVGIYRDDAAEWCGDVLADREQGKGAARGGSFFDSGENIYCFSWKTWSPSERLKNFKFSCLPGFQKIGLHY